MIFRNTKDNFSKNIENYQQNKEKTIRKQTFRNTTNTKSLKSVNKELYDKLFNGRSSRHTFMSEGGKYIYHIGIIDYLQDFNLEKKMENQYKS